MKVTGMITWLRSWFDDIYAQTGHTHIQSEITDFPTTMTPSSHTHTQSEITDFPTIPSGSSTTPSADTTNGSIGTATTWAKADHTHPKSSIYQNVFYGDATHFGSSNGNIILTTNVPNWTWDSGNILFIKMQDNSTSYNSSIQLKVNGYIKDINSLKVYSWIENEIIGLIYNGTSFDLIEGGIANSNRYGVTRFSDIVDLIYPVGSIYISVNSTSPATLFGGTWAQLYDTFLYAVSTGADSGDNVLTAPSGQGEASHSLTESEMPRHTHIQNAHNHTQESHSHTYKHNQNNGSTTAYSANWTNAKTSTENTSSATPTINNKTATNKYTGGTGTAESASNGSAHNNMPPYMKVYMWKRTA